MSSTAFNASDFHRALSQFPTGVAVLMTSDAQGNPVGITASRFSTVSMEPALILWCLDKRANCLSIFESAEYFSASILSSDQVDIANHFANHDNHKVAHFNHTANTHNVPLLNDCAAQFECHTQAVYEGGDHLIIVGEVQAYRHNGEIDPLVFSRGSYAISAQHPQMMNNGSRVEKTAGTNFVSDYLLFLTRELYQRFGDNLYAEINQTCDITPEEWRILARMANNDKISLDALSEMVMQPRQSLSQTLDWMVTKDLVHYLDRETLAASEKGVKMANKLQRLALEQETMLLNNLDPQQAKIMKQGLKALIEKLH